MANEQQEDGLVGGKVKTNSVNSVFVFSTVEVAMDSFGEVG